MSTKNESARRLILVAEDDEDNRRVIRALLELRGYGVVEAADGHEAILAALRERPDMILMDLKMPSLNGLAATRVIRQHVDARLRRTPIVALSAYDPNQHRAVAMAAGCNDYLIKPLDYDRLEAIIDSLLGDATPPRRHTPAPSGRPAPAAFDPGPCPLQGDKRESARNGPPKDEQPSLPTAAEV